MFLEIPEDELMAVFPLLATKPMSGCVLVDRVLFQVISYMGRDLKLSPLEVFGKLGFLET